MARESKTASRGVPNERTYDTSDVRNTKWFRRKTDTRQHVMGLGKT